MHHTFMHVHTQPTIYGFGRNVHLWHFPWPKRPWPKCPGRNVLGRNVRGRNVLHSSILRKTIEGYLDSVQSLTFNTIKTKPIMHAFHSS